MSRPKLASQNGTSFKIDVPEGWFTTVSIVSRKIYNHLVVVKYEFSGIPRTARIVDTYGVQNEVMKDMMNGDVTLGIIPQDDPQTISIDAYYSTVGSVKREALQQDKYRSSSAKVITNNKPVGAPPEFPDYTTFLIFVEDSPDGAQTAGAPQFDDVLIAVNILKGFKQAPPPTPIDTGSQAINENGKDAIKDYIDQITNPGGPGPHITVPPVIPPPDRGPISPELKALPVCILGAGVSGLYIAMMLDSLGIKYEIMEGSPRIGGRLYTHNFPTNQGKYQYYDVGAMRYPDTAFMQRTFDLAKNRLGLKDKMLPYLRANDNAFLCYNGISVTKEEEAKAPKDADIFRSSESKQGFVPDKYVAQGTRVFWEDILGELRKLFVDNPFDVAFKKLKELDGHTVTSYLTFVKKLPPSVIDWYETMESRTGLFNQSLTETVLASLVFMDPRYNTPSDIPWYCFDGGSEIIHKAMTAKLKYKPVLNHRAVIIQETDDGKSVTVSFDRSGGPQSGLAQLEKKYSNVISTMSLACLRMVDTDRIYLSVAQRAAIRQLTYTPSIKIGLQFKTPWWERLNIEGGQSSTDRPIRDIVYPSYGPDDSHAGWQNWKKSNCMIAAYNGMQDSQRLGGLMKGRGTPEEKVLLDLVMRDLAAVHKVAVQQLWDEYEDYYPWDFYRDQFQLGAFCQFGPGQFKNTYPHLTQPAGLQQRLHFAGDATSTFHGWVAGALNAGWRATLGLLQAHPELNPNPGEDIIEKFKNIWGPSEEWDVKDVATMNWINQQLTNMNTKP
ncbi:putative flavin containing amine oxidoreductase [Lyophyllum shimeji]|uniref:Flavin containing amine oxidoreductase n=1 Tax=Lyophyllum shimeji TaxID=47721 RepID=A0A9P3PWL9_LYOSH|nr:putative flavin containing amine oxidoreductase [Lyophyllum shimeji]